MNHKFYLKIINRFDLHFEIFDDQLFGGCAAGPVKIYARAELGEVFLNPLHTLDYVANLLRNEVIVLNLKIKFMINYSGIAFSNL